MENRKARGLRLKAIAIASIFRSATFRFPRSILLMVERADSVVAAISRSSLPAAARGSASRRVRDTTSFGPIS